MHNALRLAFCALVAVATLSTVAHSKPMMPATDEEAIAFDWVVSAEYVERDTAHPPKYFEGAMARYRILTVHKGAPLAGLIRVRYQFHDLTPCIEETGWKFDESMMPRPGNRFLLFLRHEPNSNSYYTYRGAAGRWPLTDENLAKVKSLKAAAEAKPPAGERPAGPVPEKSPKAAAAR